MRSAVIEGIAKRCGLPKTVVRKVLQAEFDTCVDLLAKGEGVSINGVGISYRSDTPQDAGSAKRFRAMVSDRLRSAVLERAK